MVRQRTKRIANQLELNFELKQGTVEADATLLEFDLYNEKENFFAELYRNRTKLKVDILRLMLADKVSRSRKPITRMLLFRSEATRKRIVQSNRSVLNKYNIKTSIIQN